MNEYYGIHPYRVPRIPLTLCGFFGVPLTAVAHHLGAMTGLPASSLPDLVAHDGGKSLLRMMDDEGLDGVRERERRCLERTLRGRPSGIIALGPSSLMDNTLRQHVEDHSTLIHLHAEGDWLDAQIRATLDESPQAFQPWIDLERCSAGDLAVLRSQRQAGYDAAMLQVDATHRAAPNIAQELLQMFELGPAEG